MNSVRSRIALVVTVLLSFSIFIATFWVQAAEGPAKGYVPNTAFSAAPAGRYRLDPSHAFLSFRLTHLGGLSTPILRFSHIQSEFEWDPAHPEATVVEARIWPTSFDSGSKDFDMRMNDRDVLRGNDMSDGIGSSPYRFMTFKSNSIKFTSGNKGIMTGELTMVGVTKPVTLNVTYNGFVQYNLWPKMGFSATGKLNRSDWGITAKPTAGDEIAFEIEFEFVRIQPSTLKYLEDHW